MAVVTPNGNLRLLAVKFDSSYKDLVLFSSITAQTSYFQSLTLKNYDSQDFTYIQKDSYIRINANADTLYNCNYIMYQNQAFTNKWFYAFIDKIEWLSDSTSAVYMTTDVWQTWKYDCTFNPSFVIREHVTDDTAGLHTIPENLELGEYVIQKETSVGLGELSIVVSTTISNIERDLSVPWKAFTKTVLAGGEYCGIYSGCAYKAFPATEAGMSNLNVFLQTITEAGATDVIQSIYMCPTIMLDSVDNNFVLPYSTTNKYLAVSTGGKPTTIDGYTPNNNKLLSYPYISLYAHNNNGSGAEYRFEDFDITPLFEVVGSYVGNPTYKLVPKYFKTNADYTSTNKFNYDESISLAGFPMCNWTYDAYAAWLAQNGSSTALSTLSSVAVAGAGVASGGTLFVATGLIGAATSLAKQYENSLQPQQAKGNAIAGVANNVKRANDFYIQVKTIKAEYAKQIDDYFTLYGYKVNRLKEVNLHSRSVYNFIKTNDINITGAIPSTDMVKLKSIFNNGVTIWHNESNVGNYSLENGVYS